MQDSGDAKATLLLILWLLVQSGVVSGAVKGSIAAHSLCFFLNM